MTFQTQDEFTNSTLSVYPRFEGELLFFAVASSLSNGVPHGPCLSPAEVQRLRDYLDSYLFGLFSKEIR